MRPLSLPHTTKSCCPPGYLRREGSGRGGHGAAACACCWRQACMPIPRGGRRSGSLPPALPPPTSRRVPAAGQGAPEGHQGPDHAKHFCRVHHLHLARLIGAQQLQHLAACHHQLVHLGSREVAIDGALRRAGRHTGRRRVGRQRRHTTHTAAAAAAAPAGLWPCVRRGRAPCMPFLCPAASQPAVKASKRPRAMIAGRASACGACWPSP